MRIVFVTPEYVTESLCFDGGLANYLHRVAVALKELGHEPIIVVSSSSNEKIMHKGIAVYRVFSQKNICKQYFSYQMKLNGIGNVLDIINNSYSLNEQVIKINEEKRIDIIQYASYLATAFFKIDYIPSVIRISSYNPLMRWGYGNEDMTNVDRYMDLLEKLSFENTDAVFGPSNVIAQKVSSLISKEVKLIESPFFISAINYDYSLYEEKLKNKKYFLFFGTLGYLKGVLTIIDIIKDILEFDEELNFVFVGKDTVYHGQSVKEMLYAAAGKFNNRVICFDKLSHELLYPIIQESYAVVLPSRVDNFPNTCLEAMGHGKVVVGTNGTSFEQLIINASNGFLINIDDHNGLKGTLMNLLKIDTNEIIDIGTRAKETISRLAPKINVKELVEFYKDTIDRNKNIERFTCKINMKNLDDVYNQNIISVIGTLKCVLRLIKTKFLNKLLMMIRKCCGYGFI